MRNNTESTVWIDMSDLSIWKGHLTGIQRVVYNLAVHYASKENTKYFTYDSRKKTFYEFDFNSLRIVIESQNSSSSAQTGSSRAKAIAQAAVNKLPSQLQRKITPEMRTNIKHVYVKVRSRTVRLRLLKKHRNKTAAASFGSGDRILIFGNSWIHPSITDTLYAQKQKHNLEIYHLIHDLIPIFEPQLFDKSLFRTYNKHMFEVISLSDGILAISKSTRDDIERYCGEAHIPCPPIHVVREGDEIIKASEPKMPDELKGIKEFILCVGTLEARKNHQLLYYVWKEAGKRRIELPNLVIVGGAGWYTGDTIHKIKLDPEVRGKFTLLKNINDQSLAWLYENCLFTIYPSMYEGWGLPVAESLAYGKLCLTTNQSSMPEIAGDLVDYFSPYDAGACLEKITYFLDPHKLNDKEGSIKKYYKPTTWHDTYMQISKVTNT